MRITNTPKWVDVISDRQVGTTQFLNFFAQQISGAKRAARNRVPQLALVHVIAFVIRDRCVEHGSQLWPHVQHVVEISRNAVAVLLWVWLWCGCGVYGLCI
jgi:hypothetical protein